MVSVRGYYDGNSYVATEAVKPYKNQNVIITLLDEPKTERKTVTLDQLDSFAMYSKNADNAQKYISNMRDDRVF